MTTIHTTDDFIEALNYNPAFKTAVLEALTPEDAGAASMPALTEAILEELRETRKTQTETRQTQTEMREEIAGLSQTQTEMLKEIAGLSQTQNEMLKEIAGLSQTQTETLKTQKSIKDSVGRLVGDNLERKMGYALPSELRTGYGVESMTALAYPVREDVVDRDFLSELDEAKKKGEIAKDERERVIKTDMIIAERNSDGERARFFVAEASNAVNNEDIDRAIETMEMLQKIFSYPAAPIAFGHRADSAVRRYNTAKGDRRVRIMTLDEWRTPFNDGSMTRATEAPATAGASSSTSKEERSWDGLDHANPGI